jgi:hypothetical protein
MPAQRSLFATLLVVATGCAMAQETLVPGARSGDCRSALQLGIASCPRVIAAPARMAADQGAGTAAPELTRVSAGTAPGGAPVTDAQIDAFLQQYGKPPKEAVRALLDPSDDNILAWLHARRRTLELARYVADRMTALEPRSANLAQAGDQPTRRGGEPDPGQPDPIRAPFQFPTSSTRAFLP